MTLSTFVLSPTLGVVMIAASLVVMVAMAIEPAGDE